MKVLITGSTAQQSSFKTAARFTTFAALMYKSLTDSGASVDFIEPSSRMGKEELSSYDAVLVGIAPPTSLSANKIYPAFAIANKARELGNLIIFIDAPEPYKLQASIKSCYLNVSDLKKDFYSRRNNYDELLTDSEFSADVYSFIEYLYTQEWPTTIFSALPWSDIASLTSALPNINSSKLFGVNLDYQILQEAPLSVVTHPEQTFWTCDAPKTKWATSIEKTLRHPMTPVRHSKWENRDEIADRMSGSIGTLVSTYRSSEPWWTPFLAESLALGKPVVTDWRFSSELGAHWSHLASTVEEMSVLERAELANSQRSVYLDATSSSGQTKLSEAIQAMASEISLTSK
jgi:hypothetical protein